MKIAIFYHTFQSGMTAFIYQQQIHRLYASGLVKAADYMYIGVNGDKELFNIPPKANVIYNKNWKEETETLVALKNFAYKNPDYKILYFHLKGGSKQTLIADSWRLMMEYFVIDRWKECIDYLDEYDCVGQTFKPLGPTLWSDGSITQNTGLGCFCGNFWWANASYIQTLDHKYLETDYRFDREFWIGTNPNCKAKSLQECREDEEFAPNHPIPIKKGLDDYEPYTHFFSEEEYMI
jgi:hypothetical protein